MAQTPPWILTLWWRALTYVVHFSKFWTGEPLHMQSIPVSFWLVTQWRCFCLLKGRCLLILLLMHLLSNVLLSTTIYHYICDFGILIKWQTWRNNMSPSNKLQTGENVLENFKIMKVSFREHSLFWTQVLSDFLMFKMEWPLLKMPDT